MNRALRPNTVAVADAIDPRRPADPRTSPAWAATLFTDHLITRRKLAGRPAVHRPGRCPDDRHAQGPDRPSTSDAAPNA